jgi:protein TonB
MSGPARTSALPLPPGAEPVITAETISALPAALSRTDNLPAPPAVPAQPAATPASTAAQPPLPVGGKLQEAVLISRTTPIYPELARIRGLFGVVRMSAAVDEHGVVKNVNIVSGDPVLATAAKQAVLQWRYKPALLNGQSIASTATIQIVFGDRNK